MVKAHRQRSFSMAAWAIAAIAAMTIPAGSQPVDRPRPGTAPALRALGLQLGYNLEH
jgi:hypothetical protein